MQYMCSTLRGGRQQLLRDGLHQALTGFDNQPDYGRWQLSYGEPEH